MSTPLNYVFRPKAPVVRHFNGAWYFSFDDHPTNWGRKYKSLQACLRGASREMAEDWNARHNAS